jgi:multiple sugar transport system permease protein
MNRMKQKFDMKKITTSKRRMGVVTKVLSYAFLSVVAIIMILPLLWLINGSLQPPWQINADPVIWIPREWKFVRAGDSERRLLLWNLPVENDEMISTEEVIQIGSRRYTTVLDPALIQGLQSAPRAALSEAVPAEIVLPESDTGVLANVRAWKTPQGTVNVVALAKDPAQEDALIVLPVEGNESAFAVLPLDEVNKGKLDRVTMDGIEFSVRNLTDEQTEQVKQVLPIGPESELWVVGSPQIAQKAIIVQSSQLGDREMIDIGQTQLPIYSVEGQSEDAVRSGDDKFVVIAQEKWQPLMDQNLLAEKAFVAREGQLSGERETRVFKGLNMTVRTYTPPDGGDPYEIVILTPGSTEYLALPTEYMDQLYAAPVSELIEPGSVNIGTLTYRVQGDFERTEADGSTTPIPSAFVGDLQDLSVIVPVENVKEAVDVNPSTLERALRVNLNLKGYQRVLTLRLSGTPFWRFFANSGYVVLMNMIGHFVSCVLVAYGFARLRAPGKNVLFVVLLATMMIPYVIFVLPTYLIFRDIGMLGTMVPLWIRSFFGNAFLIFVLRQFFLTIPYDLDEAAILDGANRWQVLWRVIVPLSKPALAMVGIFTFWWYWNSFLDPLIYTTTQKYYTVTLAMNTFNQQYARAAGYYDRILAGSVLALLPMVILFIFAQRYFIEGIQMQGLKR